MVTTEFGEIIELCGRYTCMPKSLAQMVGQKKARWAYIVGEVQAVLIGLDSTYAKNLKAGVVACRV